jgi:hypothetical protein
MDDLLGFRGIPEDTGFGIGASKLFQHSTSNMRSLVPPWPTAKRTDLPHLGQRPAYAVPSAFRYALEYAPAHRKKRPSQGLAFAPDAGTARAGATGSEIERSTWSRGSGIWAIIIGRAVAAGTPGVGH